MTTLLLCNIGNSDLLADGNSQAPRPARTAGQVLWNSYGEHRFELPIIRPYLEYFQRKHIPIDRCILFDTDQRDTPATNQADRFGVKLRDKDTLWFGAIIERMLREQWSEDIHTVERRTITRINPSLYDEAIDEYGRQLSEIDDGTVTKCYLLTAGGIQACNTALLLKAISRFGELCEALYQPEGGEPYKLRVGQQVLATFKQATVIELLNKHDFAGALTLFPANAAPGLRELVQYARDREAFDFEQAEISLEQAEKVASSEIREFVRGLQTSLDNLLGRANIGALLQELHTNATIAYRNGRYTDFLGRMFRFQESALRYIVEQFYAISTDIRHLDVFKQMIHENATLLGFLQARKIDEKPLQFDDLNRETLKALVDYLTKGPNQHKDGSNYLNKGQIGLYGEINRLLNRFGKLSELRNQKILFEI